MANGKGAFLLVFIEVFSSFRFFASEAKTEMNSSTSPTEEPKPKSEIFSASADCDKSLEIETSHTTDNIDFSLELKIPSPKRSDKENIAHRFAKKNSVVKQDIIKSNSCGDSVTKKESKPDAWLSVIDNDTSAATITLSSTGKASKFLDAASSYIKPDVNKTTSKNKKVSKQLISTKIVDYKFKNGPICDINLKLSLGSDGNSLNESLEEVEDETLQCNRIDSPYFNPTAATNQDIESENVVTILSDSKECNSPIELDVAQGPFTPQTSKKKSFQSMTTKSSKQGRCRTLGLSKNKKNCAVPRKETLLNFNFVRQPKKEEPLV